MTSLLSSKLHRNQNYVGWQTATLAVIAFVTSLSRSQDTLPLNADDAG